MLQHNTCEHLELAIDLCSFNFSFPMLIFDSRFENCVVDSLDLLDMFLVQFELKMCQVLACAMKTTRF
jgi:hypothetical protein